MCEEYQKILNHSFCPPDPHAPPVGSNDNPMALAVWLGLYDKVGEKIVTCPHCHWTRDVGLWKPKVVTQPKLL
jgi:hypothetical protein